MSSAQAPARPALTRPPLGRWGDALRDSLAGIRCCLSGDLDGLHAIANGTDTPRYATAIAALLACVIAGRSGIAPEAAAGDATPLTAEVLRVMAAYRDGDAAGLPGTLRALSDPPACFGMATAIAARLAVMAEVIPAELEQIGRDATCFLIDLPPEPGGGNA